MELLSDIVRLISCRRRILPAHEDLLDPDGSKPMPHRNLRVEEIFDEHGALKCRYSHYVSLDGHWVIRHGVYVAYHANGRKASEVTYDHGTEHGLCREFHPNGVLAAEGHYEHGDHVGEWRYFWEDGSLEEIERFGSARRRLHS